MLKIGLIGAGVMGNTHNRAYQQISGVQLTAVCDLDADKAHQIAQDWQASVYSSMKEMLDREELDAVDICLPMHLHRHAVEIAAARGKHVFCEKPIAPSAADAEAMIEACKRANVVFMVGHVVRFFPEYAKAWEIVQSGRLGEPAVIRTVRSGAFPIWNPLYADYDKSGGPLLDLAIHDFDYLRWCFGPVKRVFSRSLSGKCEQLDHTLTLLRFESGAMAHVEASWGYPQGSPFQTSMEIAGTKGILQFDKGQSYPIMKFGGSREQNQVPESPLAKSAYVLELEHFVRCIQTGATPLTSGEEALASLRVALAAAESVKTGQPVEWGGCAND